MRRLAVSLVLLLAAAAAQDYDRDAYARDYVRFLVVQLDQWREEFPRQFNTALMKPPVDAAKMSEAAKAGAANLGDSIQRLAALSDSKDLLSNAAFRTQLAKTIAASKELNEALSVQRFPAVIQSDWDQIRTTLNNLARIYKIETLAALEPPAPGGGGRGAKAPAAAAATAAVTGPVAGGVAGYIVDLSCAKRGKGMWVNAECVARCVRDGDKLVLVTDDGKVYQIANQDKIPPETYGQVVTLMGKTAGETITVEALKM